MKDKEKRKRQLYIITTPTLSENLIEPYLTGWVIYFTKKKNLRLRKFTF